MHFHCEIIMPPVKDQKAAIAQIMAPFCECPKDEDDEDLSSHRFWDWYVIGGRWSGRKLLHQIGEEKISAFQKMLSEMGITVSGFQAGKYSLQPASQIPTVDALWRDHFPDCGFDVCPLFDHSNDQYSSDSIIPGDLMEFSKIPPDLTASRVIFSAPHFSDGSRYEATFMVQEEFWNGVNHEKTNWDGTIGSAIAAFNEKAEMYSEDWRNRVMPKPDWLVVTIDYHS